MSTQLCKHRQVQKLASSKGKGRQKQVEEILVSLKEAHADQESEGSYWEVFRGLSLKAVTVCVGLVLFLQITGHPSVLYYLGSIPQTAGFAAVSVAARVAVIIGLLKFLIFLGRRPLLIVGVSGITTVSLVFLSAYYKILQGHPLVAVGALLLYIGCYQIPFAPISWLMVSEIFHIRTRERGISLYGLSVLKTFGANVLVYFAPSSLKEQIASQLVNSSLLFVGIALASVLFVVFIVPESKG
ncbi:D-xylose-proton symporter-like 3, chloroplastic [Papaver somniferum]|uniref:D-xylose-proton symporter-like 3, chloroplastic n=1 Tax=Papaver somniferum TaxID=3469 RepID=UPI000E6FA7C8|nr:D-xylose-proton symporter-like 3, chloroplastic [Papaver somniferum]